MKSTWFLAALLATTLLFSLNSARAELEAAHYDISVEIIENKALIAEKIVFEDYSDKEVLISLPKDAKVLSFYINKEKASPVVLESELENNLKIENMTKEIEFKFISSEVLDKHDKTYFTFNANFLFNAKTIVFNLTLPSQAILDTSTSAYPAPLEKITDGQRITLVWKEHNKTNFPVFVIFREKSKISPVYLVLIVLAIITIVVAISMLKKKNVVVRKISRKSKKKTIKEEVKELHLLQSEESIIKVLKEAKGEMWQKQIQLKTGFSKAKLSRTIRNLEARNLIKRIPLGNTNKIKLK